MSVPDTGANSHVILPEDLCQCQLPREQMGQSEEAHTEPLFMRLCYLGGLKGSAL